MEISINTPALLFPAISLIMLAYTNRFLALASVVRNLHDRYQKQSPEGKLVLFAQIKNLRFRLQVIRYMQILGVLSILLAILCMYQIYIRAEEIARYTFATALIIFAASLILSLIELIYSTKSLEIELSDMEGLEDPGLLDYLRKKWQHDDEE
jgi:peptidoglycan/LPS O-acetylase OafA/YrhL